MSSGARLGLLVALVLLLAVAGLLLGSVSIPPGAVLDALSGGGTDHPTWTRIVLGFRVPRVLTAALAGVALALSGLMLQTLLENPLAGPFVLGIHSGAGLGVALVVLASGGAGLGLGGVGVLGNAGLVLAASAGAGAVLLLILLASRYVDTLALLVLGVLVGYATSAVVTLLVHWSVPEQIQTYIAWSFGSFSGVTRGQLLFFGPLVAGVAVLCQGLAKPLDALLLGQAGAESLGVSVARLRYQVIIFAAVLSGAVTAFCGPVAFVGVAVPHLARGLFRTASHRVLLPASALAGAAVTLVADLVAQWPGEAAVLPVNAVTALAGAPVVAWVILRRATR